MMKITQFVSLSKPKKRKYFFLLTSSTIILLLLLFGLSLSWSAAYANAQSDSMTLKRIINLTDANLSPINQLASVEPPIQPNAPASPNIPFIYVDQTYMEINGDGSISEPYMKLVSAYADVDIGGTLSINPGHYPAGGTWDKAMLLTAPNGGAILEAFPSLQGEICGWGEQDCNRCVNNVVTSFQNLGNQSSQLIYELDGHPPPQYEESWWDIIWPPIETPDFAGHWQGVQRLMSGDGRYMIVTRDEIIHPTQGFAYSGFAVVRMGSRGTGGDAWTSNLSDPNNYLDTIIQTAYLDYNHTHPGGVQALGNYLAVGTGSALRFYDVSDPSNIAEFPSAISYLPDRSPYSGSSTGMAKLQDGRYLLVVSSSNACPLDIYISDQSESLLGGNPSASFSKFDRWYWAYSDTANSYSCGVWSPDLHWDPYQNINVVTECGTGDLYLIATGNRDSTATCWWQDLGFDFPCGTDGEDWADLYRLDHSGNFDVQLTFIDEEFFNIDNGGNFDAAAGVYVNPAGQLYLYTTEHNRTGPGGTIEFREFGP